MRIFASHSCFQRREGRAAAGKRVCARVENDDVRAFCVVILQYQIERHGSILQLRLFGNFRSTGNRNSPQTCNHVRRSKQPSAANAVSAKSRITDPSAACLIHAGQTSNRHLSTPRHIRGVIAGWAETWFLLSNVSDHQAIALRQANRRLFRLICRPWPPLARKNEEMHQAAHESIMFPNSICRGGDSRWRC